MKALGRFRLRGVWPVLYLLISTSSLIAPTAFGACPDGWDCVLADVMMSNPNGKRAYNLFDNEIDILHHNTPIETHTLAAQNPPPECANKVENFLQKNAQDAKSYCDKSLILHFAATGACKKLKSKFNKDQCDVFSKVFAWISKKQSCEGISKQGVALCGCLSGAALGSKDLDSQVPGIYEGCESMARKLTSNHQDYQFRPGGKYSCALSSSVSQCEKEGANLEQVSRTATDTSNLVRAIGKLEPETEPYSEMDRIKLLPQLNKYFETTCAKDQQYSDARTPELTSCLYDKYRSISRAGLGKGAHEKLFQTINAKEKCAALSGLTRKILADAFPTNAIQFKDPVHNNQLTAPQEYALAEHLLSMKSNSIKHFEAIKGTFENMNRFHKPQKLDGSQDQVHVVTNFLIEKPHLMEGRDLRETVVLGAMKATKVESFLREGGLVGLTKGEKNEWLTHIFDLTNLDHEKKPRTFKCKNSEESVADCEKELELLFKEIIPNAIKGLTQDQRDYYRFYLENAERTCKINRYANVDCKSWSEQQTKNSLILRLVTPSIYPGIVGLSEENRTQRAAIAKITDTQEQKQSKSVLSKLLNSILNGADADSSDAVKGAPHNKPILESQSLKFHLDVTMNQFIHSLQPK